MLPVADVVPIERLGAHVLACACLLYTSDAADERSSVDLGGRRIIKKKNKDEELRGRYIERIDMRRSEVTKLSGKNEK